MLGLDTLLYNTGHAVHTRLALASRLAKYGLRHDTLAEC